MNYTLFLKAFQNKYQGVKDKQLLLQYVREELQYLILYVLYTKMSYPVYFMGGTKLRLSYGINRFSEDIDLALDKPDPDFPAEQFFAEIAKAFSEKITGFHMRANGNKNRNVLKIMFSFSDILYDIGFSPLSSQTIKIKIELDTNPPAFAVYEKKNYRSMVGDYMISTNDLFTGFAGKIAAVLFREYQKGRDYYDLQWYLQQKQKIPINLAYLNATAKQQEQKTFKTEKDLLVAVSEKIKKLDIPLMKMDLERFILMDENSFKDWLYDYIPSTLALVTDYQRKT
ncbi:nucleotidyl transferase AbiEii/AbiGii toxin family protein [Candidatus Peregrinibacteria bacterium]|nr:nucleotidyl transferase AbiEii/AbiGii toxin family protein [Candidatus Peregrinibacteria bacterium]